MRMQRVLFAVGAVLVVLFLGATVLAVFRPDALPEAFSIGGGRMWMNLFWLLMGVGLALAVKRIWAGKE